MSGLSGMDKFSHLEDKIYLTIELAKKMREEKERLESEISGVRATNAELSDALERLESRIEGLMSERDAIQLKVEAMLDAITVIEPEVSEVLLGG